MVRALGAATIGASGFQILGPKGAPRLLANRRGAD